MTFAVAVSLLTVLVVALSRWLTKDPKGKHHRPSGTSPRVRPVLTLLQRHKPRRAEILPDPLEVPDALAA